MGLKGKRMGGIKSEGRIHNPGRMFPRNRVKVFFGQNAHDYGRTYPVPQPLVGVTSRVQGLHHQVRDTPVIFHFLPKTR